MGHAVPGIAGRMRGVDYWHVCFHDPYGYRRRQLIVGKSCIVSFTGIAGYLLLETVVTIVRAQRMEVNPFSVLTAMAVIFTLALAWNKHKYGG